MNIPRNVRPLNTEGVERSYREKRDHTTHEDERTTHEDVEVPGEEGHEPPPGVVTPIATYQHSPDEPHSFERFRRNSGRNAPRFAPVEADLIMLLEDVSHQGLSVRTEDLLTDITTPNTYEWRSTVVTPSDGNNDDQGDYRSY